MARRLRTWLRRLKTRSKRRAATSITEYKDHLGHGPAIRGALARGELPPLESLAGLGAERYTDEVFARMHARIGDLRPPGSVPSSLRKLESLALDRAGVDARFGVDGATLRALLMFSLVEAQLVRFDGLSVVEIGGGIGSFAAAVLTLSSPASYAIYDLPDMLALQRAYLSKVLPPSKLERVRFCSAYELAAPVAPFDLVYSTYAFSELAKRVAEQYFENVVRHARMGFMTYNHLGARFGIDNLSAVDFCLRLIASGGGIESVDVRADEHYRLGAGGDESCCNLLWRRGPRLAVDAA